MTRMVQDTGIAGWVCSQQMAKLSAILMAVKPAGDMKLKAVHVALWSKIHMTGALGHPRRRRILLRNAWEQRVVLVTQQNKIETGPALGERSAPALAAARVPPAAKARTWAGMCHTSWEWTSMERTVMFCRKAVAADCTETELGASDMPTAGPMMG